MSNPQPDPNNYRPNVGVAVFNSLGKLWLGKRFGHEGQYCWQCPQGGIDEGEDPIHAAVRELWEETGITLERVEPLGEIRDWLYYDLPVENRLYKNGAKWIGQRQKWFAFRFFGQASDIDLQSHGEQEFSEWRWGDLAETPSLIIPFKRNVYERLAVEFERFSHPAQ